MTYSNPYFVTRAEYWQTTNKFIDRTDLPKDSGGGLGLGIGGGLEFPIRLKENYLNVDNVAIVKPGGCPHRDLGPHEFIFFQNVARNSILETYNGIVAKHRVF